MGAAERRIRLRGVVQRPVEHDEIELPRNERQGLEIGLYLREIRQIVPRRAEPVELVVQDVEGDDVMAERGEAMRQPAGAGAHIEDP